MNKSAKGKRRERQAKNKLEQNGWIVHNPPRTKFGEQDIFNLFDLLALHPETQQIKFIQVKSNRFTELREYKDKSLEIINPDKFSVEYWVNVDYKGWKKKKLTKKGWKNI